MGMEDIAILKDQDLDNFLEVIAYMAERRGRTGTVRVCVDEGTLKLKVDQGTWSPPMGRRDPECQAAILEREGAALREGPTDWVQRGQEATIPLAYPADAIAVVRGQEGEDLGDALQRISTVGDPDGRPGY